MSNTDLGCLAREITLGEVFCPYQGRGRLVLRTVPRRVGSEERRRALRPLLPPWAPGGPSWRAGSRSRGRRTARPYARPRPGRCQPSAAVGRQQLGGPPEGVPEQRLLRGLPGRAAGGPQIAPCAGLELADEASAPADNVAAPVQMLVVLRPGGCCGHGCTDNDPQAGGGRPIDDWERVLSRRGPACPPRGIGVQGSKQRTHPRRHLHKGNILCRQPQGLGALGRHERGPVMDPLGRPAQGGRRGVVRCPVT